MSQFVPLASDDQSIPPSSTTQSNETKPSLSSSNEDGADPLTIEPTPGQQSSHNSSDTPTHSSKDWDERLLAQVQQDIEPMAKNVLRDLQRMPNLAKLIPRTLLPTTKLFEPIGYASIAREMLVQPVVPHDFGTIWLPKNTLYNQLEASLQPMRTFINDFHANMSVFSLATQATLGETLRSSFALGMEDALLGLRNALPTWNDFILPELQLPAFHSANPLLSMPPLLPDMSWLTNVTQQMNSLLLSLPTWPSFDPKRFKENIRQRLIAAFKAIEFCFAPSMSEELMYQVADTYERTGKRSSIVLLIWNYYARRNHAKLQQTVEGWQDNPQYARRWQDILRPALAAHQRGEYGLSISALTPLVEGISSHVVRKNTLLPAHKPRRGQLGLGSTESVILRTLKTAGDEANLESDTTDVAHWLRVTSVIRYVEDVFCASLEFENDYDHIHLRAHRPHRHGLLHGYQTRAMTALNSLRMFLLLDTMHDLLQQYVAKGGII